MVAVFKYANMVKLDENDVYLSYLPLPHVFDRLFVIVMMYYGASVYFYNGDVFKLKDDLSEVRPTVFCSVPRLYGKFYDKVMQNIEGLPKIKSFMAKVAIKNKMENMRSGSIYKH